MTMQKCRVCGCEDLNACWDERSGTPCFWVEEDLCSACATTVSAEEMELAKRMGLFYAAIEQCLAQNRSGVPIAMQHNVNPADCTYISSLPAEAAGRLQHLASNFDQTAVSEGEIDLNVRKRPILRPEAGRN